MVNICCEPNLAPLKISKKSTFFTKISLRKISFKFYAFIVYKIKNLSKRLNNNCVRNLSLFILTKTFLKPH